jgi:hypothetical protein
MPRANVIRWLDGEGWIVLSGGGDIESAETGHIEASALAKVPTGQPLAYIWAAGDIEHADKHLEALYDLGAPTGYLVDILTEDDDTLRAELKDAGLIVLGDGANNKNLRNALPGSALDAMLEAYEQGAVILAIGQGAAVLGSTLAGGLNWVEGAIISMDYDLDGAASKMRAQLDQYPDAYGIGIANGSALALGPAGEIETWGNGKVTIALGRNYR